MLNLKSSVILQLTCSFQLAGNFISEHSLKKSVRAHFFVAPATAAALPETRALIFLKVHSILIWNFLPSFSPPLSIHGFPARNFMQSNLTKQKQKYYHLNQLE